MVLNPHVFNLTGQLESKLPEFPTLAATDDLCRVTSNQSLFCSMFLLRRLYASDTAISSAG